MLRRLSSSFAAVAAVAVSAPLLLGTGSALAAMPSTAGIGSRGGVVVQDLRTGKVLLDRSGSVRRIPASVTKLFTVGAALQRLGPEWAPRTRVLATGQADGRVWVGDVYLVGGGDPTLTRASLTSIARQTAAALKVDRLDGQLVVDATAFDDWLGGDRTRRATDGDMGGRLGALTVDRSRDTATPAARAGSLFRAGLQSAGLKVSGALTYGTAPEVATAVVDAPGPALAQLAPSILLSSDNFYAETLLKDLVSRDGTEAACRITAQLPVDRPAASLATPDDIACATQGLAAAPATTVSASRVLRATLQPLLGTSPQIHDGSGLTRRNRVTPAQVSRLLLRLNADTTIAPVLRASLPQAGRSGTLTGRMRGTAAVGRCQAKTGTINGVSALAGYCRTVRGRDVSFAILQNGVNVSSAHAFQDRFVSRLAARG